MTRTGPADVVMSACHSIAPGRLALARPGSREPGFGWPGFGWPSFGWPGFGWPARRESAFARAVLPASPSGQPAHCRLAGRSGRLKSACPLLRSQRVRPARLPHPPCPRSPALVHPLDLYLLRWHTAPLYGWSFDPGRDMLCIFISPPRWLQLP